MKYGNFNSWEILNDNMALKTTDISFFKYNSSGVPRDIAWFWDINDISEGKKYFTFEYEGKSYKAYLSIDKTKSSRIRVHWHSDLGNIFRIKFPNNRERNSEYPIVLFKRISFEIYNISFTQLEEFSERFTTDRYSTEVEQIIRVEGFKHEYNSIYYERDLINRKTCLNFYGTKCLACGFDFELTYGIHGKDFIEVHHLVMLSSLEKETVIDPITDLIPLCSNCHRMIHRRKYLPLSLEELKIIISEQKIQS